jgi:DNA-binding transcriptional MocR family regulator
MRIPLDPDSDTPRYKQIEVFIQDSILAGKFPAGMKLPSTRALASMLEVSRITVSNAYAELESNGYIMSREGSGSYVMPELPPVVESSLERSKVFGNSLKLPDLPPLRSFPDQPKKDSIRFTGAGNPARFPVKDFTLSIKNVVANRGTMAFEYGNFGGGLQRLRQTIQNILASQGILVDAPGIIICSGSQQALSLISQLFLSRIPRGCTVAMEAPSYNLAIELFETMNIAIMDIPIDEEGMKVQELIDQSKKKKPDFIYTIPNFQNPSGTCMSIERRRTLLAFAEQTGIPIIEDDYAGDPALKEKVSRRSRHWTSPAW